MKKIATISIIVFFCSCGFSDYKISKLEQKHLNFNELPYEIRNYLTNPPNPIIDSYSLFVIIELSDSIRYSEETVSFLTSSWISYYKLIDKQKNITYRIERDAPIPFIIFKNKLYGADRYDILGLNQNTIQAKYTEYQLK